MKKLLTLLIISASITACSSMSKDNADDNHHKDNESAAMDAANSNTIESNAAMQMNRLKAIHTPNTVYFGFNRSDIDTQYEGLIKTNADYITSNSDNYNSPKLSIVGNTDDIGSQEYNLALGQKRAAAVRNMLIAQGVPSADIEVTSNGKNNHIYFGPNRADGQKLNRRADIFYTSGAPSGYSLVNITPDANTKTPQVDGSFYIPNPALVTSQLNN